MEPIVLSILAAGSAGEVGAKAAALADMHIAAEMFAKGWAYRKVAERTATGAAAQTLKETAKRLPRKIAENVTRRKLAQAIPIAGAAIGAGFNYWFLSTTSLAAYMSFREMYLVRKYPGVA